MSLPHIVILALYHIFIFREFLLRVSFIRTSNRHVSRDRLSFPDLFYKWEIGLYLVSHHAFITLTNGEDYVITTIHLSVFLSATLQINVWTDFNGNFWVGRLWYNEHRWNHGGLSIWIQIFFSFFLSVVVGVVGMFRAWLDCVPLLKLLEVYALEVILVYIIKWCCRCKSDSYGYQ